MLHTPNIQFEIHQLALNPSAKLLAVAGAFQVAVVVLPRSGYSRLVSATIDCKYVASDAVMCFIYLCELYGRSIQVGQFYHASDSSATVAKIEWHPWGEAGSTLMVMTVDGKLRYVYFSWYFCSLLHWCAQRVRYIGGHGGTSTSPFLCSREEGEILSRGRYIRARGRIIHSWPRQSGLGSSDCIRNHEIRRHLFDMSLHASKRVSCRFYPSLLRSEFLIMMQVSTFVVHKRPPIFHNRQNRPSSRTRTPRT